MKKNLLNRSTFIATVLCCTFFSLAYKARAQATTQGWDPNGTNSIGGNGTWDTNSLLWTPAGTETQVSSASLVAFTAGDVALFCAGPSGSANQGTFTITENVANLLIGGIVNGDDNPGPCTVTISGAGSLSLPAAVTPIVTYNSTLGVTTVSVPITGVGPLESQSSGSLILNAANTYTGGFDIDGGGGVTFGNNAAFGTGPITWLLGGFIQPSGTNAYTITNAMTHVSNAIETFSGNTSGVTFSGPWTLPASGYAEVLNISGPITVSGVISGAAAFTVTNRSLASWLFTATNTFTGTLTNGGTLTIGGAGELGSGDYLGTILNRTNLIYASSANQILGGAISGTGNLLQQGPGTLTLAAVNSYTGNTAISASSTLIIGGTGSLGGTYAHNITNNGALLWTSSAGSTLSGTISGTGSITAGGTASISLNGTNTFTGLVTVTNGQIGFNADLSFGAVPLSFLSNDITLNGGSNAGIRANGNITLNSNRGIYLGSNGGQIQVAGSDTFTYPGVLSGPGNFQDGASVSTGAGVLILSGSNTYTGTTIIACGTLRLGASGALPAGTPLTIEIANTGATFDLNGFSQTIGPLASGPGISGPGAGTPVLLLTGALNVMESNSTAFSGIISSTNGSLTLNGGTNTLTLNDTNTYTGPTFITSGVLALGTNAAISNSASISIAAGATLDVSAIPAFSLSLSNALSASGTSTPATINGAAGGTVSFGSQPVTLTYDGADPALIISQGTLTLNGNAFTVNGPVLSSGTYTLISQAGGMVASSGALTVTGTAIPSSPAASIVVSGTNVNLMIGGATPAPGSFTGESIQSDDTILLSFTGTAGASYIVEGTTNLVSPIVWINLSTNTAGTNGVFQYDDATSTNFGARFYRTVAVP